MVPSGETVSRALDDLVKALAPFAESELQRVYGDGWRREVRSSFRQSHRSGDSEPRIVWDAHSLLTVMWDQWNAVFRDRLGHLERSLVSELRDFRNRWAHQDTFGFDDAYRVYDSSERLLRAAERTEWESMRNSKREMMLEEYSRLARDKRERSKFIRRRFLNVATYVCCGVGLVFAIMYFINSGTKWTFATAVVLMFGFLVNQEFRIPAVLVGPYECLNCRKIIYSQSCPYCGSE